MRKEARGLPRNGSPRSAAVRAAIDAIALIGDANINGLSRIAGSPGSAVESHPDDAGDVAGVGIAWVFDISPRDRKAGDSGPGRAEVRAPPEAVAAAGAEIKDAVAIGINRKALAHRASRHVAAYFEWQIRALKTIAPVGGAKDRAVLTRKFIGVSPGEDVKAVGVNRIGGEAVDARQVPIVEADPIEQGNPAAPALVPSVRAADVGARIDQVLFGSVEDDARNKAAAAADGDVAPGISLGCLRERGIGRNTRPVDERGRDADES